MNAEMPARLAQYTAARGIPLVHISTDYVFDGKKGAPYGESDTTSPLNIYGRRSLKGRTGYVPTAVTLFCEPPGSTVPTGGTSSR